MISLFYNRPGWFRGKIEQAIKLVSLLKDKRCKLVISHEAGDEGYEYLGMLEQLAKEENVDMRIVAHRVGEVRQRDSEGKKVYTLWDLYHHADFVTYPSIYEGFGNALLGRLFPQARADQPLFHFIRDIDPRISSATMDGFQTPSLAAG